MASRRDFLENPAHRIRFGVYTPKHTSWLDQMEPWFSILARRLLKGATSSRLGISEILAFIESFDRTMTKPLKRTYKADRSRSKPIRYFHRDALGRGSYARDDV